MLMYLILIRQSRNIKTDIAGELFKALFVFCIKVLILRNRKIKVRLLKDWCVIVIIETERCVLI